MTMPLIIHREWHQQRPLGIPPGYRYLGIAYDRPITYYMKIPWVYPVRFYMGLRSLLRGRGFCCSFWPVRCQED